MFSSFFFSGQNPGVTGLQPTANGFNFAVESDNNYGPDFGIYISQGSQNTMYENGLRFCRTGFDNGSVDDIMNPDTNTLIQFNCDS